MAKIVLHQWEMSPFCNKVRRCLRWKQLEFEVKDYNGLKAREAAKLSKVGTLPVLDYDGERVQDSSAIARFLDERHPDAPLYPKGAEACARAHFWEDWAGQSLYFYEIYFRMLDPEALDKALDLITNGRPRWERALMKAVFQRRYPKKLTTQGLARLPKEEVERRFRAHLDALEALLSVDRHLAGQVASIADLSVAAQLDEIVRTCRIGAEVQARPKVVEWMARLPAA